MTQRVTRSVSTSPTPNNVPTGDTMVRKQFSDAENLAEDDLVNRFMRDAKKYPLFTSDEERAHFLAYEQTERKNVAIRNRIANSNVRLVFAIAKRYRGRGLMFLDLVQEGNLGMLRAIDKYNLRLGFKFSTYAHWWIKAYILRALKNDGWEIFRRPVHVEDVVVKVYIIRSKLEKELNRDPTPVEIWQALKKQETAKGRPILGLDVVGQTIKILAENAAHLDAPVGRGQHGVESEMTLLDITVDDRATSAEQALEAKQQLDEILPALKRIETYVETLRPRTAQVLTYRLGLFGKGRQTIDEITERYDITRQRIHQIEQDALVTLEAETGFSKTETIQLVDMVAALEEIVSSAS